MSKVSTTISPGDPTSNSACLILELQAAVTFPCSIAGLGLYVTISEPRFPCLRRSPDIHNLPSMGVSPQHCLIGPETNRCKFNYPLSPRSRRLQVRATHPSKKHHYNTGFTGHKEQTHQQHTIKCAAAAAAPRGWVLDRCGNDPSAGSPTDTLLRLHLPLNGKV